MSANILSVREFRQSDIDLITSYWMNADGPYLLSLGVDQAKIPTENSFLEYLQKLLDTPIESRLSYCIIWEVNGEAIGHSNTNPTRFGEDAFMHLHIWNDTIRKMGHGAQFVKMTLPYFFRNLQLKRLFCEPYALNPAPNKTLEKVGFKLLKEYITTPGAFNFEQPVKRWGLTLNEFNNLPQSGF